MEPLKNLFSPALVTCIAFHLEKHVTDFNRLQFEKEILHSLQTLELKERAQLIADQIHLALPHDNHQRSSVLLALLHPDRQDSIDKSSDEQGIRGWGIFPLTLVVGQQSGTYGINDSLHLLKAMTQRFTAEFGIRDLLLAEQTHVIEAIQEWVTDANCHVRRLVSEGTRPRLPWAKQLPQLIKDPTPVLPLLTALRDDQEDYVRRSVANHLNDIARDHPDLIAQLANDWMIGADKNRQKLIRHACRSLIKQGHPLALKAFGIEPPNVILNILSLKNDRITLGNALEFCVTLQSNSHQSQQLIIDYRIHFLKANGTLAPKVFKGTTLTLEANVSYQWQKKHMIKLITTRQYYEGIQALSLRINGHDFAYIEFELLMGTQD